MSPKIASQVEQRVLTNVFGGVGAPVPTLIGYNGVIAGSGECLQLMAVGVPRLGETMAEEDERTLPFFGDVHADPVRVDEPV